MGHHHEDHQAGQSTELIPFQEKAAKLVAHWIHHNDDHARNYRRWAEAFRENDLRSAAALLETAAELTRQINAALDQAAAQIPRAENSCPSGTN